jgi:hypothetical protein
MFDADDDMQRRLNETLVEEAHPFEAELQKVVFANHRLLLEDISVVEDVSDDGGPEEPEANACYRTHERAYFDDRRMAATGLALVGLVTLFRSWLETFVEREGLKPKPHQHTHAIERLLTTLNEHFAAEPKIPVRFFTELVDARDSIIHRNSESEWEYKGVPRKVAPIYVNAYGRTQITLAGLEEAYKKAVTQIAWYSSKLRQPL